MKSTNKEKLEVVDALQAWAREFRDKRHPAALTLFRAAALILRDVKPQKKR